VDLLEEIAGFGLMGESPVFFFSSQLNRNELKEVASRVDLILTLDGSVLERGGLPLSRTKIVNLRRLGSDPENRLEDLRRWIAEREQEKRRQVSLEVRKIHPARYKISVELHGRPRPFWLVLPQTFHPAWRAYVRNTYTPGEEEPKWAIQQWFRDWGSGGAVLLQQHYPANGYANAWYVDGRGKKHFDVILDFCWQLRFELGALLTLFLAVVITGLWGFVSWRTSRNRS